MHLARQPLTLAHKILIAIAMCRSWAMFIDDETFMIIASCKKHCNMLIIHIWIRQDSWIFIEDSSFMAAFQECLSQMSKNSFKKKVSPFAASLLPWLILLDCVDFRLHWISTAAQLHMVFSKKSICEHKPSSLLRNINGITHCTQ